MVNDVSIDESQTEILRGMVNSLSGGELESAAKTSYQYFLMTISPSDTTAKTTESGKRISQLREEKAMAMARRYLVGEKGNAESALAKMKKTIQFRDEVNVDAMRRCCYETGDGENNTVYADLRTMLDRQCQNPAFYVCGYDKAKRAILHADIAEQQSFQHPTDHMKAHVYIIDRAAACTERMGKNTVVKCNVVLQCRGVRYSTIPPLGMAKALLSVLQNHLPELIQRIYLLDAQLLFRAFWNMITPFIDPVTKSKVIFVTGEEQKRKIFGEALDVDQCTSFMIPEGTLTTGPVDMKTFLYDTPYDYGYGEEINQ